MKQLLLVLPLLLLGCSGAWEKDPFAGYSENVRNGEFPNKTQKPTTISKEAVRLDINSFYEFTEGLSNELKFNYRIFDDRISFERFYIEDLDEKLPGAQFNEESGSLTWNPEVGFVSDRVGRSNFARIQLKVIFLGYQGSLKIREERITDIHVFRSEEEGILIKSAEPQSEVVVEGQYIKFDIVVSDIDSPTVMKVPPFLEFLPLKTNDNDLAKSKFTVEDAVPVPNTTHDWKFVVEFFLSADIPDWGSTVKGIVAARNAFGKRSKSETFSVKAVNRVDVPASVSWKSGTNVYFQEGVQNVFQFTVFDREEQRSVDVEFSSGCEGESIVCKCELQAIHAKLCSIIWTPANAGERTFGLTTTVSSRSNSETFKKTFSRRIGVR